MKKKQDRERIRVGSAGFSFMAKITKASPIVASARKIDDPLRQAVASGNAAATESGHRGTKRGVPGVW
jgi:hypothetical protein